MRTQAQRRRGVLGLVHLHLLDDRARAPIRGRQGVEMALEVLLDLALGLSQEAEVPALAEAPRRQPEGERAAIPQRSRELLLRRPETVPPSTEFPNR